MAILPPNAIWGPLSARFLFRGQDLAAFAAGRAGAAILVNSLGEGSALLSHLDGSTMNHKSKYPTMPCSLCSYGPNTSHLEPLFWSLGLDKHALPFSVQFLLSVGSCQCTGAVKLASAVSLQE